MIQEGVSNINKENIRYNLEFFASDELQGRETATIGEQIASRFLELELKKCGIKPLPELNGYFQKFPVRYKQVSEKSAVTVKKDGESLQLRYEDEFICNPGTTTKITGEYPIVFAGYGFSKPEWNLDSYAGLDVKNKIVVVLNAFPPALRDTVLSEYQLYMLNRTRIATARSKGAAAVLFTVGILPGESYDEYADYFSGPVISAPENDPGNGKSAFAVLYAGKETLKRLFGESAESLIRDAMESKPLTSFHSGLTAQISIKIVDESRYGRNVIGVIEGSDPELRKEYVAIGAHYDHLGIRRGEIYNGADDDASGTIGVLEVARALCEQGKPKRSVLVVFHSGEEKGLLGSAYLTENLSITSNIIAQINLDMIGREHVDTIYCIGTDKLSSQLRPLVEEANRNSANIVLNYKFDDPNDPMKLFYRSDHFNYAKKGIPIVFFYDYMLEDYHKSTDDADKINFEKIERVSNLVYSIVSELANAPQRLPVDKDLEP